MRVLLVAARYPWPARRGDQIRALQALAALAPEHQVTLLAPRPASGQPPPPAPCPFQIELYEPGGALSLPAGFARAALAGWPAQTALFVSGELRRRIHSLRAKADVGILPLARLAPYAADFGDLPLVVDLIDSLALNFERRAAVDRPWLRPLLRHEAGRLERAERGLVQRSRRTLVVCERDRLDLARRAGPALAERLAVVGIECEAAPERPLPAPAPPLLSLTGNLGYFVNADAALWFLDRVWPRLRHRRPDLRLRLAGDRPTPAVRRAAAALGGAGVELLASPPDLRLLLAESTLALAPMRCGSGVPIKVLEAWALGVPVVASPWAAAGTPGRAGVDFEVPTDDPDAWVETIAALLDDPVRRAALAHSGRALLIERFSRGAIGRAWRSAILP